MELERSVWLYANIRLVSIDPAKACSSVVYRSGLRTTYMDRKGVTDAHGQL